jgi:hypothetical protein
MQYHRYKKSQEPFQLFADLPIRRSAAENWSPWLPEDFPDESLGETINQVRGGRIDPRSANTLGYLAAAMLKALQQGDIEARLRAIEAVLTSTPPKH